jgi:lysozyme
MTQGIRSLNLPQFIFGMDSSKWEDNPSTLQTPNYQTAYERGCHYNYLKASQGLWVDKSFKQDWANCRKTPMKLGAYHFLQWNIDAKKQAEFFYNTIKDDPGELPPCVDFEWWNTIPSNAFDILYNFLERMKQLMPGKRFVIYTAYGFWMQYGRKDPYWKQYLLWLAHYNNTPPVGTKEIPAPWEEWFLWQYTGHGDGLYYGMESKDVDLDYANPKLYNEIVGELPEEEPDDPNEGDKNMYRDHAIGVYLKENPNWTQTAFRFVVGQSGNWYGVNPNFKTISDNALAKKLPLITEFEYDCGCYTQYVMNREDLLPPLLTDEMYQAFLNATAVGKYVAIAIRIHNPLDQYGKIVDPKWISWGARMFLKRVSQWRDKYKPGMKIIVATSGDFIKNYAIDMSLWVNNYEPYVIQKAAIANSIPISTEVPRYYTSTCKFWEYYQNTSKQGLVLFSGNVEKMNEYLHTNVPIPEPEPEEPESENENMLKMKVTSPTGLRVRNAPNTITGQLLSTLKYGEIVTVYDVAGMTSAWVKISPTENRWCCVENQSGRYLAKIQ